MSMLYVLVNLCYIDVLYVNAISQAGKKITSFDELISGFLQSGDFDFQFSDFS